MLCIACLIYFENNLQLCSTGSNITYLIENCIANESQSCEIDCGKQYSLFIITFLALNDLFCKGLKNRPLLLLSSVIVIILSLIRLMFELLQLILFRVEYVKDWINWAEDIAVVAAVVFVFPRTCFCIPKWQWQIGVIAILLGWLMLGVFLQKFPRTGIYVLMLENIIGTFFKVILLALLLIIAFSLAFYMTFHDPNLEVLDNI